MTKEKIKRLLTENGVNFPNVQEIYNYTWGHCIIIMIKKNDIDRLVEILEKAKIVIKDEAVK